MEPQITVSILSWLLEDRLIKTLINLPLSTSMLLNLTLHVQGEEQISREKKREIYAATSGFVRRDIYFTPNNYGVTGPRANLLKRSIKTPYVFMTDNDMDFQEGSIDALYNFLEAPKNSGYGAVNLVDNTLVWHRKVDLAHKRVTYFPVSLDPPKVVDIDICGACCTLLRSKIAKMPGIIDTDYYLGTWDIDLCMNIKKAGWKFATLCDRRYKATNDTSQRTSEYLKVKGLNPLRLKGIYRFMGKWKISSEVSRDDALNIKYDATDTAIITRAIYNSLGDRPGVGVLTESRIKSMKNFFIPSLRNQTNKDFTLYIYVGEKNNEATEVIECLNWSGINIKFIYANDANDSLTDWQASVEKSGNWGREEDEGCPEDIVRKISHPNHTIMARLDNDDWVAPGWVTHMKHMASTIDKPRFLINYRVIGQSPDGRLYNFFMKHTRDHVSPFFAIVQKDSPKISPYAALHLKMGSLFDTVYTIQPSYVFMVISDDNRSNRIYKNDKYFENIAIEELNTMTEKVKTIRRKAQKLKKAKEPRIKKVLKDKKGSNWKTRIAEGNKQRLLNNLTN